MPQGWRQKIEAKIKKHTEERISLKEDPFTYLGNGLKIRKEFPRSFIIAPKKIVVEDENHWSVGRILCELYRHYRHRDIICVRRRTPQHLGDTDRWAVVIGEHYYATITKSKDGVYGDHLGMVFYQNNQRESFPIASFTMEGHFTKPGIQGIADYVMLLLRRKKFFTTAEGRRQIIKL